MQRKLVLSLSAAALCFTLPGVVLAHGGGKGTKGGKGGQANPAAAYDTNGNGIIDGDEIEALQAAFAADPTGALKVFDTNNDGKLDAAEINAIRIGGKHKGNKKHAAGLADPSN